MEQVAILPFRFPDADLPQIKGWNRALGISVAIHGLALGVLIQSHVLDFFQDSPTLPPLAVQLPAPPKQVPLAVAPEPVRAPTAHFLPSSPELLAAPTHEAEVQNSQVPMVVPTPVDRVADLPTQIAAPAPAPIAAVPDVPHAPPVPPARNVAVEPDAGALAGFSHDLAESLARHKRYPRVALMRQWQGTAVLRLGLGRDGQVKDFRVLRSSGYDVLDRQALDMLHDAMPLPALPARLAGLDFSVDIPVEFRIAN